MGHALGLRLEGSLTDQRDVDLVVKAAHAARLPAFVHDGRQMDHGVEALPGAILPRVAAKRHALDPVPAGKRGQVRLHLRADPARRAGDQDALHSPTSSSSIPRTSRR